METWDYITNGLTVTATNKRVNPHNITSYVFTTMNEEDIPNVLSRIREEIANQLKRSPTNALW